MVRIYNVNLFYFLALYVTSLLLFLNRALNYLEYHQQSLTSRLWTRVCQWWEMLFSTVSEVTTKLPARFCCGLVVEKKKCSFRILPGKSIFHPHKEWQNRGTGSATAFDAIFSAKTNENSRKGGKSTFFPLPRPPKLRLFLPHPRPVHNVTEMGLKTALNCREFCEFRLEQ